MEELLTQITDPNIVLETITSQSSYLETRKCTEKEKKRWYKAKSCYQTKIKADYLQWL